MSQQINLYESRLRPRHDVATARNLGVCALLVLVLMSALVLWTHFDAKRKTETAASVQKQLAEEQEELTELAKAMADRKVSPGLASERDSVKAVLVQRQEIMSVLDSGQLGNTAGFSGIMMGFARQASEDLWLTGFSVTMGGEGVEIHGRLLDPSRLPVYMQRLSSEPVFQGRRFAALEMHDVEPDDPKTNPPDQAAAVKTADAGTQPVVQAKLPRFTEFVLRSENLTLTDSSSGGTKP